MKISVYPFRFTTCARVAIASTLKCFEESRVDKHEYRVEKEVISLMIMKLFTTGKFWKFELIR